MGGAAEEGCQGSGDAVAQEGLVDPWIFDVVLAGDAADCQHIAEVFDGRGDGDRDDEEDRFQVPDRESEGGDRQPGGFDDALHRDQRGGGPVLQVAGVEGCLDRRRDAARIKDQRGNVAGDDAAEDRDQAEHAFAEQGDQDRHRQGDAGDSVGGRLRHQPGGAVAGAAGGHVDGDRRQDQADDHDHRTGHHRRQYAVQDV